MIELVKRKVVMPEAKDLVFEITVARGLKFKIIVAGSLNLSIKKIYEVSQK